MDLMTRLEGAGVDVKQSLARFGGNEALYTRFLNKFLQDLNKDALKDAINAKNFKDAEIAAHTLKGVAANLGMTALSTACSEMVSQIRAGQTDNLEPLLDKITSLYENVVGNIQQN
ncbi:MAG: Hpt domain-containing protein [Oscillospiraceae bacterium]|jgi:HPt (histidine-containing phosphotransfer) domain-containing protein|nr:Hpt domain-containing protein [Oscillospiraceae bacterium]